MPLLIAGQTEGWKLYAQLTNGSTLVPASDDIVVYAGVNATDPIGGFQDSTHLFTAANSHRCSATHLNNNKFVSSTQASVNGSTVTLPIPNSSCTLEFSLFSLTEIVIQAASFYSFGATDLDPVVNVTFLAVEGGASTSWKDVNGSSNALALTPHPVPATIHNWFVGTSMSSLAGGIKTGTFKITSTYI